MRCWRAARPRLHVVGVNSTAETPNFAWCDQGFVVPPTRQHADYVEALRRVIRRENIRLVFNGRDEELAALADLAADPSLSATRFLVPPPDLVAVFNDKYETARFARAHGLPFAPSAFGRAEALDLAARYGWPLLAKPRWNGHASKDVFLLPDPASLDRALALGTAIIQAFLPDDLAAGDIATWSTMPGLPWSWSMRSTTYEVEALIGPDGTLAALCQARCVLAGGLTAEIVISHEPAVDNVARNYAERLAALGHRGPLNLQGKLVDGRYVPFELNARFAGCSIARAELGHNLAALALSLWLPDIPAAAPKSRPVRISRHYTYVAQSASPATIEVITAPPQA